MEKDNIPKKDFIREQIRNKPLSRRRIAHRIGITALCALVFAVVAGGLLLLFAPFLRDILREEPGDGSFPEAAELPEQTERADHTEENGAEEQSAADPQEQETNIEEMTLEEYQELQSLLYDIGMEAEYSLVEITSVADEEDWFRNSYDPEAKKNGVLLEIGAGEILILAEKQGIEKTSGIRVTFFDGSTAEAVLKKYDANTGIALLSVDCSGVSEDTRKGIREAEFGDSGQTEQGTVVIAVGNPRQAENYIFVGSITSVGNEISVMDHNLSLLTTDIAGSGNTNGILLNTSGEIIGLIMREYNPADSENTLAAAAFSDIKPVLDMLMEGKDIPYLGMYVSTVTDSLAENYDLPKGVYISAVSVDSPAMSGGIQSGDIITRVDGKDIGTVQEYYKRLLGMTPGQSYPITVRRQGADGYTSIICNVEAGILE